MVDCAGVGICCGTDASSSITQSALPAVSAWLASNKNFFIAGVVALMVKINALLVPPPGNGEKTVTEAVPAVAIFAAGIKAVNCVALINVVVNAAPFQLMVELLIKFDPSFNLFSLEPEEILQMLRVS